MKATMAQPGQQVYVLRTWVDETNEGPRWPDVLAPGLVFSRWLDATDEVKRWVSERLRCIYGHPHGWDAWAFNDAWKGVGKEGLEWAFEHEIKLPTNDGPVFYARIHCLVVLPGPVFRMAGCGACRNSKARFLNAPWNLCTPAPCDMVRG